MTSDMIRNISISISDTGNPWTWTVKYQVPDYNDPDNERWTEKSIDYSTNSENQGLWQDGRQVQGTCQFSMPNSRKAAYNAAYRLAHDGYSLPVL